MVNIIVKGITFILIDIISIWVLNSNLNTLIANEMIVAFLSSILLFLVIIILFSFPAFVLGLRSFDHIENIEVKGEVMRNLTSWNDGV